MTEKVEGQSKLLTHDFSCKADCKLIPKNCGTYSMNFKYPTCIETVDKEIERVVTTFQGDDEFNRMNPTFGRIDLSISIISHPSNDEPETTNISLLTCGKCSPTKISIIKDGTVRSIV